MLDQKNEMFFSQMVDKYHHELCVYAHSLTGDISEAKDIVQNVFLKIWKKRKFDGIYSEKGFLYTAVYKEFLNFYRSKKKFIQLKYEQASIIDEYLNENKEEDLKAQLKLVKQEIQNLPKKCKQVFVLSKQEGLSNKEIAEYLDISTKTVENHISRAFTILRTQLKNKVNTILFLLLERQTASSQRNTDFDVFNGLN